jgi:multidrug efflux pump subunit AcrA (membrane-fusion protein)
MRNTRAIILLAFALAACREDSAPEHAADHVATTTAQVDHSAHGGLPEGHAEVEIPVDRQQVIGLEVAPAERTRLDATVRATAIVQTDEKREAHVHSKLMGYVRTLHVNAVGQKVKKGQPLYSIYSQELLVAQQEYLRARKFSTDLAEAARERLRLWDIPEDQIRAIEEKGAPLEAIVVRSPIGGTVIEKTIVQGHFLEPDMMLYRIADLSRVWVIAEVYEYELGRVDRKGTATIRVEGVAEPITATIDYVYPTVDPRSRTVKVRMVVANPQGLLRPGNFATVELPATGDELLTVPDEAVIDTGLRRVVYVATGEGRFRPVEVEVGRRIGGRAEIRKGLAEGDRVVVSAQFLVDSESRLRAAGTGPGHGGH